ncbi:radial spoke head protein 3 homolog isoform X1 [Salarias fasciatus]|uniref:radial spoke head protein 3 homolog isoform X1 n=1 Tax=Salarias fasciatus TaxID=181472 RepID=UPI001177020A|nr:radial spoke head protein 3 homolog isoform X1 [Salarias fasciatus]
MAFAPHHRRDGGGLYSFSSRPRAVESRPRYREPPAARSMQRAHGNIMYDRRVVRGNTYGRHVLPPTGRPDPAETRRQPAVRQRSPAQRAAREQLRGSSPEALLGRKHVHMQTERYLEELSEVLVSENAECQTDAFLDRPASPLFVPAKSGKDVATQIEEGDLFDFDVEVQPVLEVLVGKVMEQSLLEVMEEEELASLKAQQRTFEELRNSRLAEVQRLQEQERRHSQERERRIAQQKEVLRKEKETAEKIAARAITQQYLAGLQPAVFSSLRGHGFFYDPVERDVETNFLPWLMAEVNDTLRKRSTARQTLDNLIQDVCRKRVEAFMELEAQQHTNDP